MERERLYNKAQHGLRSGRLYLRNLFKMLEKRTLELHPANE